MSSYLDNWWRHEDLSSIILQSNGWQVKKEGRREIQKIEYLKTEKSFSDEIKSIFHSFWRAIIWWKNKNLMKIADTSFNLITLWIKGNTIIKRIRENTISIKMWKRDHVLLRHINLSIFTFDIAKINFHFSLWSITISFTS